MKQAVESNRNYATVNEDGINYRFISATMTILGYPMNHSSARNYVLRAMTHLAEGLAKEWGLKLSDEECIEIARNSLFQNGIAELLRKMHDEGGSAALFNHNSGD